MKKIITIAFFAFCLVVNAQVELKGIMIGSKFKGSESDRLFKTSVAKINGVVLIDILKDSTISGLMFIPMDETNNKMKVTIVDEDRVKLGMEKKYGITFEKKMNESPLIDYSYNADKDGIKYSIVISKNEYTSPSVDLRILIYNNELAKKGDKEEQQKINNDF